MRRRVIVGFLLAAMLPVAAHAAGPPQEESGRYHAADGSFSYVPPPGWELTDFPGMKYRMAMGPRANDFTSNINVVDEARPGPLEDAVEVSLQQLRAAFRDYRLLERGEFETRSGERAVKIVGEARIESGQLVRFIQFLFDAGNRKLVATCSTLAEGAAPVEALCDEAMRSFRLEGE